MGFPLSKLASDGTLNSPTLNPMRNYKALVLFVSFAEGDCTQVLWHRSRTVEDGFSDGKSDASQTLSVDALDLLVGAQVVYQCRVESLSALKVQVSE